MRLAEAHERDEILILAAHVGLGPAEFYDLSHREFECFLEGYQKRLDQYMDLGAWAQANLMNIHIPRGKPRLKPEDLRGKRKDRSKPDERTDEEIMAELDIAYGADPRDRMRATMKARAVRAEREESARFFASPAGKQLRKVFDRM